MKKYLIVNADDLGLNAEINAGIIDSFKNGCVTSASLITTEESFNDAVEKTRENPSLDIGIHLNIVRGQAKHNLPLLFLKRVMREKVTREKIYQEFERQIKLALDKGLEISHLDTEKHLHIFPFILKIVIELAKKYHIRSIRFPFERIIAKRRASPRQLLKIFFSYIFYRKCSKLFKNSGIKHPDFFYGISLSNKFRVDNLKEFMDNMSPGISELSCHPAFKIRQISSFMDYSRNEERETLTNQTLIDHIKERGITLTNFKIFNG